jgi:anti-sigma B factor antagonist
MYSYADASQPQFLRVRDEEPRLRFNVEIRENDDVAVLYLRGRLVYSNEARAFFCKATELLPGARQLVVDLSGVEKIDGAGLGELVAVWNSAQAAQSTVKLVAPTRRVASLLALTHLTSLFEIHPTLDEAVLAWRGLPA